MHVLNLTEEAGLLNDSDRVASKKATDTKKYVHITRVLERRLIHVLPISPQYACCQEYHAADVCKSCAAR